MLYYRGTKSSSPMSDWGHAMFVDNYEDSYNGLGHEWTFDGNLAVPITSLKNKIIAAWDKTLDNGYYYGFSADDNDYFTTLTSEDVFNSFDPADIVNSADGFDSALVTWLCEMVLEPNNISAITTQDGAIVFDESLIQELVSD